MRAFLKFIDERVWVSVEKSWSAPSISVAGVVTLTNIFTQTKDELVYCT